MGSTRAAELALATAASRPTAAVVSATDEKGRSCLPLVRMLTQLRPTVPVIGYCAPDATASRDVLTLARAGVHDVMFGGIDDQGRAVRRFVETAATACGVAEALGVHRKTLFLHCRGVSAPPPSTIMTWCRLLLAAHSLGTSLRSVEAVALDLGFASATSFRNLTKRYTGLRPTEFRDGTAMPVVTRAFLAATQQTLFTAIEPRDGRHAAAMSSDTK